MKQSLSAMPIFVGGVFVFGRKTAAGISQTDSIPLEPCEVEGGGPFS